jgi:hypothetical protein
VARLVVVEEIKGDGSRSSDRPPSLEDDGYLIEENSPASGIIFHMMDKYCNGPNVLPDEEKVLF